MLHRPSSMARGGAPQNEKLPESFVKEVSEHTDLVELVGAHVKLKKSGASFMGLCPFHSEKSPSFTVSDEKHFYHCFGCGKHGDAIAFLMEYAGLTFREAVTELAQKLGKPMPSSAPGQPPAPSLGPLYERIETAYRFYRNCLRDAEMPKNYMRGRGITADSLKRYAIAFAPEGWQSLQNVFPNYLHDPLLLQAGLVKSKENSNSRYDTFRNRLIFAIKDARGRIVGFGGRALSDEDKPKYLNSPESAVFDKGSMLFGVHEARAAIQARKQAIVVEGYMDVVMLAQHGIENVVASMGTACTPRQIERLCALAPETVFTFDGDNAGKNAAWKALENCMPYASDAHVFRFCLLDATADGGKDPDEIVRNRGREAFEARLARSMPLSAFLLTQLSDRHNGLLEAEDRARFLNAGMELIRTLPHGSNLFRLMREELSRAANVGVSEVIALTKRPTYRQGSKEDAFWQNLSEAVSAWPAIAAVKVEEVVRAMSEEDYAEVSAEKFSGDAERHFWTSFLSMQDAPTPPVQEQATGRENLAHRDLVHNITMVIIKHKDRVRRARLSSQYRQGLIKEDEFIAATIKQNSTPLRGPTPPALI